MHRQPGHAGRAALTPKPFEVAFELGRLDLSWGRPRHPGRHPPGIRHILFCRAQGQEPATAQGPAIGKIS